MTKEQMQSWVLKNCKFAIADKVDKFSTAIVSKITKASKEISGDQFSDIVVAVLMRLAYVPISTQMQIQIKKELLRNLKGKEKFSGPQMKVLMNQILLGTETRPGIVRQFNYDPNSPVLQNIIDEVISGIYERKGPSDRPQGDYSEQKRQEEQEAQQYMGKGLKIHFTPRKP